MINPGRSIRKNYHRRLTPEQGGQSFYEQHDALHTNSATVFSSYAAPKYRGVLHGQFHHAYLLVLGLLALPETLAVQTPASEGAP